MLEGNGVRMLVLFDLPDESLQRMKATAPGLVIQRMDTKDPLYTEALTQADIVVGWPPAQDLPKATRLRWLQIASAGANRYIEVLPPHVALTNASGVFGIPIAEHVFAMMLALVRGIADNVRTAGEPRWHRGPTLRELCGTTCLVLGLGDIGTEVARRAKAFGMRVLAVKRRVTAKPAFVDELWDVSGLDCLLKKSDHVVVTLPGTGHTYHMIDERRLALMKPGSFIYNVGRGSVIDEQAMTAALQSGHLGGAGLDVFEKEPLPLDSPLWKMPNVIVSPHRSGNTVRHGERLAEIVMSNLPRFLAGKPLENLVDRYWGY